MGDNPTGKETEKQQGAVIELAVIKMVRRMTLHLITLFSYS